MTRWGVGMCLVVWIFRERMRASSLNTIPDDIWEYPIL
jgi:hypothetical protein